MAAGESGTVRDWAIRLINYNNRQLFEALFDFFWHPVLTAKAYFRSHNPGPTQYNTLSTTNPDDNKMYMLPALHWFAGLLLRILLLPVVAPIYVLSRMAALNPFHHFMKAELMLVVYAIPIFLILNNVYEWIPTYVFPPLFGSEQLMALSSALGMPSGLGMFDATAMGGVIAAEGVMIGMAFLLHIAKKMAQWTNARTLPNPSSPKEYTTVTSPKYNAEGLYPGRSYSVQAQNEPFFQDNPYQAYNRDYLQLLYNVQAKKKLPIEEEDIPENKYNEVGTRQVLYAFERVNKAHEKKKLTQEIFQGLLSSRTSNATTGGQDLSVLYKVEEGRLVSTLKNTL